MTMLPAADLHPRDVIHTPNWDLHVTAVDALAPGAVVTAEFPFVLHYPPAQVLDVDVAQVTQL